MVRPGRTVLIVDDDDEVRSMLRLLFEAQGFEVVAEAVNGSEAVLLAGEAQPEVIILDFKMPGMTAKETAAILRRISPDARIILFSAYVEVEPDWPDAYLSKTHVAELIPLVKSLLDG